MKYKNTLTTSNYVFKMKNEISSLSKLEIESKNVFFMLINAVYFSLGNYLAPAALQLSADLREDVEQNC